MKLASLIDLDGTVNGYREYIQSILDTDIEDLSNSDLSFIKLVAPSSISTMKKKGRSNLYILTHSRRVVSENSKKEKAKKLLSSFDRDELLNFLYANGFMDISSKSESESEVTESESEVTESESEVTESESEVTES